jgi:aerobic-type carbon monoxide dehydrogenase small subunit (CoxS/CutS family)
MFNQNGTDFPLVAGVYSTRQKALLALDADEEAIHSKLQAGLNNPVPPRMVDGPAPCQEFVLTEDAIDIRRFPIPQYSPKDGGRYVTLGILVSTDPETGVAAVSGCLYLALFADGAEVVTVDSLDTYGRLSPVQEAFIEAGAFQCGYCTPGLIVMVTKLLDENPDPDGETIKYYLSGNLCRCATYPEVLDAAKLASSKRVARASGQRDEGVERHQSVNMRISSR